MSTHAPQAVSPSDLDQLRQLINLDLLRRVLDRLEYLERLARRK